MIPYTPISVFIPLRWKLIGLVVGVLTVALGAILGVLLGVAWMWLGK